MISFHLSSIIVPLESNHPQLNYIYITQIDIFDIKPEAAGLAGCAVANPFLPHTNGVIHVENISV